MLAIYVEDYGISTFSTMSRLASCSWEWLLNLSLRCINPFKPPCCKVYVPDSSHISHCELKHYICSEKNVSPIYCVNLYGVNVLLAVYWWCLVFFSVLFRLLHRKFLSPTFHVSCWRERIFGGFVCKHSYCIQFKQFNIIPLRWNFWKSFIHRNDSIA